MTKSVLLTQPLPESALEGLKAQCNLEVLSADVSLSDPAVHQKLAQCSGLICLLTDRIDQALVASMPKLEFVSSVSVGVDHVDVPILTERGIALGNTPGVLVDTTADTAFALLLAAARRVAEADRFIRNGQWTPENRWSPDFFLGKDVSGATLGILGLGDIGQAVARRAAGFGMKVLSWSRSGLAVAGVTNVSLEQLLADSDFLSIHVALTPETRNMVGALEIAQMKPGAVLVNTARGGIVNEQALAEALSSGHLYAAGIDVFEGEPLATDSALLQHPRVVLTPHIGSATTKTRLRMVDLAVDNAIAALRGEAMPFCVNPEVYEPGIAH